jgi:glycosyltransferase involved in cell wall biosynthesis
VKRLAVVASHVIQYQDPFFRRLAAEPELNVTVLFFSSAGAQTYRDADMATTLAWDIEMLQGYRHEFLRNFGRGTSGWFRHVNPGIVRALRRDRFDAVLFMTGWGSFSSLLGIAACILKRIPFFLYGDSSFVPPETTWRATLRARLARWLFRRTSAFLISGTWNADYYRHYGADPARFFPMPWAIDNERFRRAAAMTAEERQALRAAHGIAPEAMAVLYSGKLIPRKDPMTLLRAFEQMARRGEATIVFMGDGELRGALERYGRERGFAHAVHFTGFVNQSDIPRHYAMCDVFVLPSTFDPRATVVNEAMACGLPVIVTDRCGPAGDIVRHGDNGFVLAVGDAAALASDLDALADRDVRERMGRRSLEIIEHWDYETGIEGVNAAVRAAC